MVNPPGPTARRIFFFLGSARGSRVRQSDELVQWRAADSESIRESRTFLSKVNRVLRGHWKVVSASRRCNAARKGEARLFKPAREPHALPKMSATLLYLKTHAL